MHILYIHGCLAILYTCTVYYIDLGKEKPTSKELQNHVIRIWASKWRELGIQLNIDQHVMDIIERDNPSDCKSCCSKMFSKWLEINVFACWEDIITAVDNVLTNGMYT